MNRFTGNRTAWPSTRDATTARSGITVMPPDCRSTNVTSSGCAWPSPFRSDHANIAGFFERPLTTSQRSSRPNPAHGTAMPSTSLQIIATDEPLVGLLLKQLVK